MKNLLLILWFMASFGLQAQKFKPDVNGYVGDPAFLQLVKSRGYQLVKQYHEFKPGIYSANVLKGGQWIYLDQDGKEFLSEEELQANYARLYHKDIVEIGAEEMYMEAPPFWQAPPRKTAYQTKDGPKTLESRFDLVKDIGGGRFLVFLNDLCGIYNDKGKELVPVLFVKIEPIYDTYIAIKQDRSYWIYSNTGKQLQNFKNIEIYNRFGGPIRIVENDTAKGLYDLAANRMLLPCIYESFDMFYRSSGYTTVKVKSRTMEGLQSGEKPALLSGIVDSVGKLVLEPVYNEVEVCDRSGYFVVKQNEKYGVIGRHGEILLPLSYESLHSLDYSSLTGETNLPVSLLVFKENGKCGVMDIDRKVWVKPAYDGLVIAYIGLIVFNGKEKGIMTPEGKFLVPMQVMEISNVAKGIVSATKNGKKCKLDFYGNCFYE